MQYVILFVHVFLKRLMFRGNFPVEFWGFVTRKDYLLVNDNYQISLVSLNKREMTSIVILLIFI